MCKNLDISEVSVIWQFVLTGQIKIIKGQSGCKYQVKKALNKMREIIQRRHQGYLITGSGKILSGDERVTHEVMSLITTEAHMAPKTAGM